MTLNEYHAAAHRAELTRQADVRNAPHRREAALDRPPRTPITARAKAAIAAGLTVAVGIGAAIVASATLASAATTTGTIHFNEYLYATGTPGHYVTHQDNINAHDVVTGAIADHGLDTTPTPSSPIFTLHLTKGTVTLNATGYYASKATTFPGGKATCSFSGTYAPGKVVVVGGTGAYAGITGNLTFTGTFAFVEVRKPSGACDNNHASVVMETTVGVGTVSY